MAANKTKSENFKGVWILYVPTVYTLWYYLSFIICSYVLFVCCLISFFTDTHSGMEKFLLNPGAFNFTYL